MLNKGDHSSFSDLFSVFLRTIDRLNSKLRIFSGHTASFKTGVWKVLNVRNFELPPIASLNFLLLSLGLNNLGQHMRFFFILSHNAQTLLLNTHVGINFGPSFYLYSGI